jgi:hypothetical protein
VYWLYKCDGLNGKWCREQIPRTLKSGPTALSPAALLSALLTAALFAAARLATLLTTLAALLSSALLTIVFFFRHCASPFGLLPI